MYILKKKKVSLSISPAKLLGWRRGRGGPGRATACGEKPVNFLNYFFSKIDMVQSCGFATPSG